MDRNCYRVAKYRRIPLSLSARRAWIEIDFAGSAWVSEFVALRKESVDRNANKLKTPCVKLVALRKESVDRNSCIAGQYTK